MSTQRLATAAQPVANWTISNDQGSISADDRSAFRRALDQARQARQPAGHSAVVPIFNHARIDTGGRAETAKSTALRRPRPVAGASHVSIDGETIKGQWILSVGPFGCPDSELRGGTVVFGQGRFIGGGENYACAGDWTLDGSELRTRIDVIRHRIDPELGTLFGNDTEYQLDCTAEIIAPDLIEGRIRRPGYPDARLTMWRPQDEAEADRCA